MPEFLVSDPNEAVLEITVLDSDLFSPNGERERERLEGSVIMMLFLCRFLGLC